MKKRTTAFYIETLIMILVFVAVILILSHVFGIAVNRSREADMLTRAVSLAQNTAETLEETIASSEGDVGGVIEKPEGDLTLTVKWRAEQNLLKADILVAESSSGREVYSLPVAWEVAP